MKCPVCKETNLVMTERQSIEIDYCPDCRGVWLDRGELDKIIERSTEDLAAQAAPRPQAAPVSQAPPRDYRDYDRDHKYRDPRYDHYGSKPKYYKKKSLLGELFDF